MKLISMMALALAAPALAELPAGSTLVVNRENGPVRSEALIQETAKYGNYDNPNEDPLDPGDDPTQDDYSEETEWLEQNGVIPERTWDPTKLQLIASAVLAYGPSCGNKSAGHTGGDWASADGAPSSGGAPDMDQIMQVDHGCLVAAAAEQYSCFLYFGETKSNGKDKGGSFKFYESGAKSPNVFNAKGKYATRYQGFDDKTCIVAIRGTDFPDSADMLADAGGQIVGSHSFGYTTQGSTGLKTHQGFDDYYHDHIKSAWTTLAPSEGSNCKLWFYSGHSLGGVMASWMAMDSGARYGSTTTWDHVYDGQRGQAYTIGALAFIDGRPNQGLFDAGAGFRWWHDEDFAPNMQEGGTPDYTPSNYEKSWNPFKHSNGSYTTKCVGGISWLVVFYCSNNNYTLRGKKSYKASSGYCKGPITFGNKCTQIHHGGWTNYMPHALANSAFHSQGVDTLSPTMTFKCGGDTTEDEVCPACCRYKRSTGGPIGSGSAFDSKGTTGDESITLPAAGPAMLQLGEDRRMQMGNPNLNLRNHQLNTFGAKGGEGDNKWFSGASPVNPDDEPQVAAANIAKYQSDRIAANSDIVGYNIFVRNPANRGATAYSYPNIYGECDTEVCRQQSRTDGGECGNEDGAYLRPVLEVWQDNYDDFRDTWGTRPGDNPMDDFRPTDPHSH